MKKNYVLLVSALILLLISFTGCNQKNTEDKSLEKIREKGYFVVGLDDNFPPMGFRDKSGEIVGFDIDMAKEAAKRMGVEVKFKPVDWDGVILSLKKKDIDLIWNGLTVTEERKKQISFSKIYLSNRQIIIVNKDSNINSKDDLKGKIIGVQLGSSSEQALNSDKDLIETLKNVRKYSNNTEALLDLKAKRIDAVVIDEIVGRYYIAKRQDEYRILEENIGDESYAVGIKKEDVSFREELDRVLDEMKKDGTAAEISKKWFGEDIVIK
ncbi:amino acid ABC transporter substrate-binding protein, PAAT family [Caloranaerobacter azorensis DSM 13643]|uniref:Amino acid ABC transporter substrate-binding protein, PAAT family n=1 Tax=Caloranaerobacter azorensis DSM 13643 TaxID=1121264 RepID=A0A1M5U051_9FIRM|nr:amino acid ABC transporter substrate-binding protein [Caloranaerobacter azorensis]SHH56314.1 amino acid ABC transporter substrate-binding protein, PAAT family [Caloranaerobacter azorensis DSM 13643]